MKPKLNVKLERFGKRMNAKLGNLFGGTGQGFAGLIYVYHPVSGAELQFICKQGQ